MALETIANLTGKFDQFGKRVDRMQTESDNTKSELTEAIRDLKASMDAGFIDLRHELKQEIQTAKRDFGSTRNWQISFVVAVVGLAIALIALFAQTMP